MYLSNFDLQQSSSLFFRNKSRVMRHLGIVSMVKKSLFITIFSAGSHIIVS